MQLIVFIIPLVWSLLAFSLSKKYSHYLSQMDSKEYPFKYICALALWLVSQISKRIHLPFHGNYYQTFKKLYPTNAELHSTMLFPSHALTIVVILSSFLVALGYAMHALDLLYILFTLLMCMIMIGLQYRELVQKNKQLEYEILSAFPGFLTRLSILLDAGITVSRALEILCLQDIDKNTWQKELNRVVYEIQSGISMTQALEHLSRRVKLTEVTKFVSFIIQNHKKGNRELSSLIRLLAQDSWASKKRLALKLGEEASAKMVFPMILILFSILLLVATPALFSMFLFM